MSFYCNFYTKVVTNNRIFWKTVEPFLSENVSKHSKINLVKGKKIISWGKQIKKAFFEYFINIPNLNMPSYELIKTRHYFKTDS